MQLALQGSFARSPQVTAHAQLRAQQRGIRAYERELVFHFGDREEPAGGGCYRLSFSRRAICRLQAEGRMTSQQAERCKRLVIVTDGCDIITNYRG